MKHTRRLLASFGIILTTLAVATAGWAYWSAAGIGSGSATVGTLNPPTGLSASPSGSTVTVTWSPVGSPGGEPVKYYVLRDGQAAGGDCPTSSAPLAVTECSDTNVGNGSHHYVVVAVYRSWTAESNQVTVNVSSDSTAPALVALEMFDTDTNGKVDQVKATFSETLAASNATGPWTLTNVPSGGTLASVATDGAVATLTLTEGAGAANSAVGSFTVALAANPAGIRDAAGNQSSFAATAPADKAAPVAVAIASANKTPDGTAGKAEQNDTVTVTFSEPLASLSSTTSDVVLSTSNGNDKPVILTIPSLSSASGFEIGVTNGYLDKSSANVAFNGSTLSQPTSSQIRVTLTAPTGTGTLTVGSYNSSHVGTPKFSPATTLADAAGNAASGSLTPTVTFF